MLLYRSFKFRLYPNKKQEYIFKSWLKNLCDLYNWALRERIDFYKTNKDKIKKRLTFHDQEEILVKTKTLEQKAMYAQVLLECLLRVDKSYQRFFDGRKKRNHVGYPRFKKELRSFCYPQYGFKLSSDGKYVKLGRIGDIRVRLSRPVQGKIKQCQVIRDGSQWYVSFLCEIEMSEPAKVARPEVGVDLGILHFATLSDGTVIENPKFYRKYEKKLAWEQRKLSRKKRGSNNRYKQKMAVAKVHRKIRNCREDFLHKETSKLIKMYGKIVVENLNVSGMERNKSLSKAILDCSWSSFTSKLQYKAASAGVVVTFVNPARTSQICSGCGEIVKKTLAERVHCCKFCGLVMDRDLNAAKNILAKGTVGHTETRVEVPERLLRSCKTLLDSSSEAKIVEARSTS